MSSHFQGRTETEKRTRLSYWLSLTRERTAAEHRFVWHAATRAGLVFGFLMYFMYCNPESTVFYKHLRAQRGWDDEPPLFPQALKWEYIFPTIQAPWAATVASRKSDVSTVRQEDSEPAKK